MAVLALILPLLPSGPAAGGGDGDPDAPVFRLIEALRGKAADLKVDGRGRDWEGFPLMEEAPSVGSVDASRDIVGVALAPREDDLLVMLRTRGRPSRADGAFGLRVDFLGGGAADLALDLGAAGAGPITLYPEGLAPLANTLRSVEVAVGDVVEVRIPLLVVASWLPEAQGRPWMEGKRRPWVRVECFSRAPGGKSAADEGPAAASFRLVPTPCPLDAPAPRPGAARRPVGLPVQGKWFVRQGAFGLWSHGEQWAYDLSLVDAALRPSRVQGSRDLSHYYAFGQPVVAPEGGRVIFAEGSREDHAALVDPPARDNGNNLMLRFADGLRLFLAHLRGGTVRLAKDDSFAAGDWLAEVGNSGDTRAPHLHLALHDRPGEFTGLPLAFREVRVGLNPCADDPWARDLPSWEVREGCFVEAIPRAKPASTK